MAGEGMERVVLRDGWYIKNVPDDVDLNATGIYEWRIEGVGVYVGKAKRLKDRMSAYPRNVRRMLEGRPWRQGKLQNGYRRVHHALRRAHDEGHVVTFSVLELCSFEDYGRRETAWVLVRRQEEAEGGLMVLNGRRGE